MTNNTTKLKNKRFMLKDDDKIFDIGVAHGKAGKALHNRMKKLLDRAIKMVSGKQPKDYNFVISSELVNKETGLRMTTLKDNYNTLSFLEYEDERA